MSELVSVVMPCYNQAAYISETLTSVISQTYENWEVIIVDDGSNDHSVEVIKGFINNKISLFTIKNSGPSAARNFGISKAKGKFILPLDADDLISVDYLELAIKQFRKKPDTKLVYAQAVKFGAVNEDWKRPEFNYRRLLMSNYIYCSAIFKKSDFEAIGGYSSTMVYGYEDWDFWIRFLDKDDLVHLIDKVCFYYRIKEDSRNWDLTGSKKKLDLTMLDIYRNNFDIYNDYFGNPIALLRQNQSLKKNIEDHIMPFEKNTFNRCLLKYMLKLARLVNRKF